MIRLKWANGEHEVTGCLDCPMRDCSGDHCELTELWVFADGYDEEARPDWCPLLTLEVERDD